MQTHSAMRSMTGIGRPARIGSCKITPSVRRKTIIQVMRYSRVIARRERNDRLNITGADCCVSNRLMDRMAGSVPHGPHPREDRDGKFCKRAEQPGSQNQDERRESQ